MKNDISNTYTLTEDNTEDNKHIVMDPEFAKGVKITLKKTDSWEKNAEGVWPDTLEEVASNYSKAYSVGVTNRYKKATIDVVKINTAQIRNRMGMPAWKGRSSSCMRMLPARIRQLSMMLRA